MWTTPLMRTWAYVFRLTDVYLLNTRPNYLEMECYEAIHRISHPYEPTLTTQLSPHPRLTISHFGICLLT